MILAGDAESADMPTEAEWKELRVALNGQGLLRRVEKTTLSDGTEAIEMEMERELPEGGSMIVYTLAVPKGDNAFMMSFLVMDEAGDAANWTMLTSSVKHAGGTPVWIFAAGAVFVLGLLVFMLRGDRANAPAGRVVVPDAGFQGPGSFGQPTMGANPAMDGGAPGARPSFGGQMPSAAPSAPPAAPVPVAVSGARQPEAAPQIPGLRSTLPPSGHWGKK